MNETLPPDLNQIVGMSDDALTEHACLIGRGVRPMALLGTTREDYPERLIILNNLDKAITSNALSFMLEVEDGCYHYGYVQSPWILDLYKWINSNPEPYRGMVRGLLFGYSPSEIGHFVTRQNLARLAKSD